MMTTRTRRLIIGGLTMGLAAGVAIATGNALDDRVFPRPGRLVDVGGRRLHLQCSGTGSPTVILESGLGETSAAWKWILPEVARETRVCAYDRAGQGWSEPASSPRDGTAVAADLERLLTRAGERGPLVLVGHSTGAAYVRIFGGRHAEQVAGVVLLDGQPAEAFERLPTFPAFYRVFRIVSAVLPRGLHEEVDALPATLQQARSSPDFGDRPLMVVTAARGAQSGWLPLQDRMAALSTTSLHRVVPYSHAALVTDADAAQTSLEAIGAVVRAVRRRTPTSLGG